MSQDSQIRDFFKNQSIFVTGATGLVGKLLIEKLLQTCEIKTLNLLIRPKKSKTAEHRLEELFANPCFHSINTDKIKKVRVIKGDCNEPNLGLSQTTIEDLIKETTCIFHVAARIKFDQTLKEASCHVSATQSIVEMAEKMPSLRTLVYVSTAYSNCLHQRIKEEFYEPPMKAETFLQFVQSQTESVLRDVAPHLLNSWPNTYIYTKSISEDVIKRANLPSVVLRPSLITNTIKEPLKGYVDNTFGIVGIKLAACMGITRSYHAKRTTIIDIVPADYVSNCAVAAAWKAAQIKKPLVYNCVGYKMTLGDIMDGFVNCFYWDFPSTKYLWYKSFKLRENKIRHQAWMYFYFLILYFFDFLKKTNLAGKYKHLNNSFDLMRFFASNEWSFDTGNIESLWHDMSEEEKKMFTFKDDLEDFKDYFRDCALGIRLYLLKDPIETIPEGQKKLKKMLVLYYCVNVLWFGLVGIILVSLVKLYW